MCEAWFYMGLLDRQRGDLAAARAAFEKCMGYRIYIFYEHSWANAELKKLAAEEAK
jgi:lipoprotein NlpI